MIKQGSLLGPFLTASVLIHAAVLGGGALIRPPEFAVERAPSSLEIVMIEQSREPMPKEKPKETEILLTNNPLPDAPVVAKKAPEKKKEEQAKKKSKRLGDKEVKETVVILPSKGALGEAKPDYLKNPAPVYPQMARERGWEGLVTLSVLVDRDGRVSEVTLEKSSGHSALDHSAQQTVRKWRFQSARVGGVPVPSRIRIPVRFILDEEER